MKALIGDSKTKIRARSSVWWSDIMSLGKHLPGDFFTNKIKYHVGIGYSIPFWHSSWFEVGILKDIFSALFSSSHLHEVSISGMGGWVQGECVWGDFGVDFTDEPEVEASLVRLAQLLPAAVLHKSRPDLLE